MASPPSAKRKRKQTSAQNAYIGKAGQLAVMAELALRGYNVSLPEIDKGDDIFVVNDHTRQLWRVQVKAATPQANKNGNYQVVILDKQITTESNGKQEDLHFVFALRDEHVGCWQFVIVPRAKLQEAISKRESQGQKFGSLKKDGRRTLGITRLKNRPGELQCSREPWTEFLNRWDAWPCIKHDDLTKVPATGELVAS